MIDRVIALAQQTGELVTGFSHETVHVEEKADRTLVTEADHAASQFLIEQLPKLLVGSRVLSEEGDHDIDLEGPVWVIDPIDGTSWFTRGDPNFSVSIGLLQDAEPVLGVVHAPERGETWWAERGKGAFRRGEAGDEPIGCSSCGALADARGHRSRTAIAPRLEEAMRKLSFHRDARRLPCSLNLVDVASSGAEFYVSMNAKQHKWDTAAAQVILEEAGGRLTDLSGDDLDYLQEDTRWSRGIIASNGALHDALTEAFRHAL